MQLRGVWEQTKKLAPITIKLFCWAIKKTDNPMKFILMNITAYANKNQINKYYSDKRW